MRCAGKLKYRLRQTTSHSSLLVARQSDVSRKLNQAFLLFESFNFNFVDEERSDIHVQKKLCEFIYFLFYLFLMFFFLFYFNNQREQRKMLRQLHIRCYSYQVKKQFCRMNSVLVLTTNVSVKHTATVDRRRFVC